MDVILYSNNCPRCKVLKQKLDAKTVDYTEENSVEKMLAMGIEQTPVLSVNGSLLSYNEAIKWAAKSEVTNEKQ